MRATSFLFLASALVIVTQCSSPAAAPCTLKSIGADCNDDSECCTGYCDLEGDTAACQATPKVQPACIGDLGFCTQNRNCCSGLCESGACFAGGPGTSCLSIGSTCIQDDSCCTGDCIDDGQGHTACAAQPQSDAGVTCGLPGDPCSDPGNEDLADCCFAVCTAQGVCGGGGGGGGGGNCAGSGSQCRYGSDCCDGVCETLSSGSVCH